MAQIQERLSEEEIELLETMFYPPALAECIFSDLGNPMSFDKKKFGSLRWYQYPVLSWEQFFDFENQGLTDKQIFQCRKSASECYTYSGRGWGKTQVFHIIDLSLRLFYSLYSGAEEIGFASYCWDRIQKVLDKLKAALQNNLFLKEFCPCNIKASAPYSIVNKNTGMNIFGINFNIFGRNPGSSVFGIHIPIMYQEESSFESEAVFKNRKHSRAEFGCIFRFSGMATYKKNSPAGEIVRNPKNKKYLVNLPQKVNPNYTVQDCKEDINDFGGEKSPGFKIFVDGDAQDDITSVYDMERVRQLYEDTPIQSYEINKESFNLYQTILNTIVRPSNAERIFTGIDIGDASADTEITIFSELRPVKESHTIYKYCYNVTLYHLTDDEQQQIIKYLMEKLNIEMTSIDIGSGTGKAIFNELSKTYAKNLYAYYGNEKIITGHKRNENGDILKENGEIVYTEEFAAEFSVKRLQQLFYNNRMILLFDPKFDKQFDQVTATFLSNRVVYKCMSKKDHIHDSFRTFAIAQWVWEFKNLEQPKNKELVIDFV